MGIGGIRWAVVVMTFFRSLLRPEKCGIKGLGGHFLLLAAALGSFGAAAHGPVAQTGERAKAAGMDAGSNPAGACHRERPPGHTDVYRSDDRALAAPPPLAMRRW